MNNVSKNQQHARKKPEAKDEKVHEEAELEEGLRSIQPAGNEAAYVELMDKELKNAKNDNIIAPNDSLNIVNGFRNDKNKKFEYINIPPKTVDYDPNDDSVFRQNGNLIWNDTGSEISDESDPNIISTSINPKKKPSKDDEKKH
ncbi:MAG: hypothetical protein IJI41_12095 [Anaerolineaceae bacterium]|nr:hypothetical protein [Anaerolineaceae bacterium]